MKKLTQVQLWRKNNPEKYKLQRQNWIEKNKEKYLKNRKESNQKRIKFKGKTIFIGKKIRTGICSKCNRSVKNEEIKQTQMHHIKYDDTDPTKYTIELCVRCHTQEHKRLRRKGDNP